MIQNVVIWLNAIYLIRLPLQNILLDYTCFWIFCYVFIVYCTRFTYPDYSGCKTLTSFIYKFVTTEVNDKYSFLEISSYKFLELSKEIWVQPVIMHTRTLRLGIDTEMIQCVFKNAGNIKCKIGITGELFVGSV